MSRIPQFLKLLEQSRLIHEKKNQDYATSDNPYSNFEFAASLAKEFSNDVDKVFATLVGVKIARLGNLQGAIIKPQNESIEDTFLDLFTYVGLWASYNPYIFDKMDTKLKNDMLARTQNTF